MEIKELEASQVRFSYSREYISELRRTCSLDGIVGQPRALSALRMGMSVRSRGYNIYISGEDGTGRHSAVRQIAAELSGPVYDLAYVYNFQYPESPLLLVVESPLGVRLRDTMETAANAAQRGSFEQALSLVQGLRGSYSGPAGMWLSQACLALSRKDGTAEKYRVNLAFEGNAAGGLPVVSELHPTHSNLFGQLGHGSEYAHLNISCGSVLRAAGGFFTVNMNQLLSETGLWDSLKLFAESSGFLVRDENSEVLRHVRPAVPFIPVKLILIGSEALYDKLCETDEQFLRLFKICAEFDYYMPATAGNISGTVAYLLETASKNGLKPVTDEALCELLRFSSWYAEMRDELTTRLSYVGDLLFEADYFATDVIDAGAVKKAVRERDFANGITEHRINQEIKDGEMIISLEGTKTGVVNGLAVMDRGLVSFGTPAVISVSVAPGSEGIVNIEHEAGLSGEIHDKGLLILEGYLRKQYARTFPLSMYAGICFEQSYAEVDGDSASSSELFALLSAIGELPVRQDIAVTGSVNQLGDIQPVGGINEKITGFFDICSIMGLSGRQGVIIPVQNIKSIILPDRVVEAIEQGKFHIYPISTIDEGMEILTLRPSGVRGVKGNFPVNTVNRIIEDRLHKLYELSRTSG